MNYFEREFLQGNGVPHLPGNWEMREPESQRTWIAKNYPEVFKLLAEFKQGSQIVKEHYNDFADKKEVTELLTAITCTESDFAKRDEEGNKIEGEFLPGIFEAVGDEMRRNFVSSKHYSLETKNLCIKIVKNMNYTITH